MNPRSLRMFAGIAFALLLLGCERTDDASARPSAEPVQRVTNATPIPQVSARDPSVPDAATALAKDAVDEANKSDLPPQKADPQREMTKSEESRAMPLPSQANDHSTTALDKGKGK